MASAIERQWTLLALLPKPPRKIEAKSLLEALARRGFRTHLRTIQRDLSDLARVFPIVSDERQKPYGWRWSEDAEFLCTVPRRDDAPALETIEIELAIRKLAVRTVVERLRAQVHAADESDPKRTRLRATVEDSCAMRRMLLGHASDVEVVSPASLRREIAEHARRAAESHAR